MLRSLFAAAVCGFAGAAPAAEPLPSWNEGPTKRAIIAFIERITNEASPDYVPPAERIATFDNDGCLWAEKPFYFQARFALDRVRELAADHPEWADQEPFASVLAGEDVEALAQGKEAALRLIAATHAGMTTEEFAASVEAWAATARHPRTGLRYVEMTYRPMVELLEHLRANGFKTFIVSGGGIDFLRVWAERAYGIPPEQVVGSSVALRYDVRDGRPVIARLPEIGFIDDKAGKPVGIHQHIGRRPILAVGNSDGDFEMLEWTTAGEGPRLGVIVRHTDAQREWAYDRESTVGRLDRALDEAPQRGWLVVDMRRDWSVVFDAAE
ncbi:MAG: HAD family hydrolase [Planctomycetota bacterium]